MAEKVPKIKYTYYDVGNAPGNYFRSYQSLALGIYHADGCIGRHKVQMDGKDIKEIEDKLLNFLTEVKRQDAIDISISEGFALKVKEGGLGKLVKEVTD